MQRRTFVRRYSTVVAVLLSGCASLPENTPSTRGLPAEEPPETVTGDGTTDTTTEQLSKSEVVELSGGSCEALSGATFKSTLKKDGGVGPTGTPTKTHWRVTFGDGEFEYGYTDVVESGRYSCTAEDGKAVVRATTGASDRELTGRYDPKTGILQWDGVDYRPVDDGT